MASRTPAASRRRCMKRTPYARSAATGASDPASGVEPSGSARALEPVDADDVPAPRPRGRGSARTRDGTSGRGRSSATSFSSSRVDLPRARSSTRSPPASRSKHPMTETPERVISPSRIIEMSRGTRAEFRAARILFAACDSLMRNRVTHMANRDGNPCSAQSLRRSISRRARPAGWGRGGAGGGQWGPSGRRRSTSGA